LNGRQENTACLPPPVSHLVPAVTRVPEEIYGYELPVELIAQGPRIDRASSRLMVVDRDRGTIEEDVFEEIGARFRPGDVLVRNDTRVFKARVHGTRRGFAGRIEALFFERIDDRRWRALLRPGKRVREGAILELGGVDVAVLERNHGGERVLEFPPGLDVWSFFEANGEVPLPPYVKSAVELPDYQTVYARSPGAVAAPTAGFHFTPDLFESLEARGVSIVDVTLHVGPGTFLPIRSDDYLDHEMHREWFEVPERASRILAKALDAGSRIIPVGSTSMRVIETVAKESDFGPPLSGWTSLYVTPGDRFKVSSAMITNFHLPRTTLLLLVLAFGGTELVGRAYQEAIRRRFEFFSFGDAMFIV